MTDYKNYSYRMAFPGVVEIVDGARASIRLNEKNARMAITNIKARCSQYATEEACRRHLEKHEGALDFLLAHKDDGHADDCPRQAALAKARGGSE